MEDKKVIDEQALENKCPTCTASIKFNPKVGKFKCDYCGNEFTLEEMQKHKNNASTKEKNKKKEEQVKKDTYDAYISYRCESCGAEIIADEQTAATFCVYCGNTAILKSKLSGVFTPDKIIPFKQDQEAPKTAFKGLSKGRPLMPKDFNSEKNIEKIKGVYIPFWLYDLNVSGDIDMMGEIVTTWTRGDTHYTKTDKYKVVRGGTMDYEKIPVDGSSRFDNDIMNSIEPFNFNELIPYNHAYLSGFYAEKYDEEGEVSLKEASDRALNSTKDKLKNDATRYTTKVITGDNLVVKETSKEYAMLPVYMVNVKYKDKIYIFAMNGQTGEFIGNIPLDKTKTIIYSVIIFVGVFILTILGSYILFLLR